MMPQNEQKEIDVIIYRVGEQGLEVFLVNPSATPPAPDDAPTWQAPVAEAHDRLLLAHGAIGLEPATDADGTQRQAIAIEADWHEIPSLRALMYEDYRVAKQKAKQHLRNMVPDMEKGAYVAVKDAVKRVMPHQYAFLKELKDIVFDKNQTKYI
jgi:hypothetical protein